MRILSLSFVTIYLLVFNFLFSQDLLIKSTYYMVDNSGKQVTPTFSDLSNFNPLGIAIFAIGGKKINEFGKLQGAKYGLIDNKGKILLSANYDYIYDLGNADSLFIAYVGNKCGVINNSGKIIIPISYQSVDYFLGRSNLILVSNANNYKQLYNFNGEVLSTTYTYIFDITNGFIVQKEGYEGVIDNNFKTTIPLKYRTLELLENGTFLAQDKYQKFSILDNKGNILSKETFDQIDKHLDKDYKTIGFITTIKGKKGFLDANLNTILPNIYNDLIVFETECNGLSFAGEKKMEEWYLLDGKGNLSNKEPFKYVYFSSIYNKYLFVKLDNSKGNKKKGKSKPGKKSDDINPKFDLSPSEEYTLVDYYGNPVIKDLIEEFKAPSAYNDQKLILLKSNGKWTGYDEALNPIIQHPKGSDETFSFIENIHNDIYIVQIGGIDEGYGKPNGGVYGIYNSLGDEISPIIYEDIATVDWYTSKILKVKKNGKYGLISFDGNEIAEVLYNDIDCTDGKCIISLENPQNLTKKYGVFDANTGKIAIPIQYDYLNNQNYTNYYIYANNNKFGLIEKNGNILIKPTYSFIELPFNAKEGLFLANVYGSTTATSNGLEVEGGNWGVINTKGDTIIPFQYKKIEFANDTTLKVIDLDDKAYLLSFPALQILTDKEANFIDLVHTSYDFGIGDTNSEEIYIIGKDVILDNFGNPSGGIYGLTDIEGNMIVDFKYAEINPGFICTYNDFNGFDLIDNSGKILINNSPSILFLNDSLFLFQKDGRYALYNKLSRYTNSLNNVVQLSFPEYFYGAAFIGAKNDKGNWGVINELGEWIIQPAYCDIQGSSSSYIIAAKCTDGVTFKYGVIDAKNNMLIPFEYDSIEEYYGEYKCVQGKKLLTKNLMNETLKTEEATDENIGH